MKSPSARPPEQHPHLDHLFKVGVLHSRSTNKKMPKKARAEAKRELLRYRDEGLIIQKFSKEDKMATRKGMTKSGFCAFPADHRSHVSCKNEKCTCTCHESQEVFSGKGIIFAVIDDRENMGDGRRTTVDIIADGIEAALDAGHETSEEIARYMVTSAFQHVRDRRVRFNSVLKAGDVVGAHITRKLYNAYNDLAVMAEEAEDAAEKRDAKMEATGFAEAVQIVFSPFSSEDPKDFRLVNWDMVDMMTEEFEKEQRLVRKARNGNPQ
ncbi:hypothetical protein FDJ44_gp43 [Microbacterium phage Pikmin]|uniref:Uncharacterized protein n=3 Tax=Pikminvirus pikmin TaxID=2560596 RepID=A0A2P1CKK7_9CAUD|nr:hypothetical protein FDJ44_gp43 [Microbacterium phage Pikmin]AVJ51034.1 hypothetical protein PBI_PAJAZA_43 [Microbacterium phage Pajaza]AVJ51181.1 hypothetical protein PBI_PIKMIN_43 [Microbacterium phage Pikmin]AVJ51739.1 hypothetical protein PBI_CASEY_43 [Microbacterium phage Casey]